MVTLPFLRLVELSVLPAEFLVSPLHCFRQSFLFLIGPRALHFLAQVRKERCVVRQFFRLRKHWLNRMNICTPLDFSFVPVHHHFTNDRPSLSAEIHFMRSARFEFQLHPL